MRLKAVWHACCYQERRIPKKEQRDGKRNSLALKPLIRQKWRTKMQTEIEILESRENPMIVWY